MIDQITWTKGEFLREKIPLQITNYSITRIGGGFWHLKIKISGQWQMTEVPNYLYWLWIFKIFFLSKLLITKLLG